jgi:NAD(P)-dependent dehydrogenase (short-subunit alcohol dehydrogenase family)
MNKPIALIIGASDGIGLETCRKLKDEYFVINMSRRRNEEVENICVDITDYNSVISAFSMLKNKFGSPQIMVYSAGWVQVEGLLEISYETWHKTLDTCLSGAFYCTQQFAMMCDKSLDNRIIYIASTAGTRPSSEGWSAYSSAKSGLIEFAGCMSLELQPYIKVYCISPGRCNTRLRSRLNNIENKDKIMQPYHVTQIIKQLINDKDKLLDGQNIIVRQITE